MKRIAFTADWHIGISTHSTNINGIPSRTLDSVNAIKQIIKKAKDLNCDYFIIGGDLFHHSNPKPQYINIVISLLEDICNNFNKVIVIAGNHDPKPLDLNVVGSIGLLNKFFSTREQILCFEKPTRLHSDKMLFWIQPYMRGDNTNPFKNVEKDNNIRNILITHLHFKDAIKGTENTMISGGVPVINVNNDYDFILSGHIHKPQKLYYNNEKISVLYPGSPTRFDFSDRDDKKGFWVIDIPKLLKDEIKFSFYELDNREMFQIVKDELWLDNDDERCINELKSIKGADVKFILKCNDPTKLNITRINKILRDAGANYIAPIEYSINRVHKVRDNRINKEQSVQQCIEMWLNKNKLENFNKEEILSYISEIINE